ncbi:MAG TPA: hypothetical protein VE521_00635 [Nitrososphaera sp.]|jgi:hypothetical protein|nr:hypothetical protein [Nitrososphaera sp.]
MAKKEQQPSNNNNNNNNGLLKEIAAIKAQLIVVVSKLDYIEKELMKK